MMSKAFQLSVRLLLLLVLIVDIPAQNVLSEMETSVQDRSPQFLTSTLTVYTQVTAWTTTTEVISKIKTCAVLVSSVMIDSEQATFSSAPTRVCKRKKRQYLTDPVLTALKEDNPSQQYYKPHPINNLLSVGTTALPRILDADYVVALEKSSPLSVIEPSFEKTQNVRVARPMILNGLSSMISSIMSSLMTTTIYKTSPLISYWSTATSTVFTSTATFYIFGDCYPSGIVIC